LGDTNRVLLALAAAALISGSLAIGLGDRFVAINLSVEACWNALLAINGISIALTLLKGPLPLAPGLRWCWPQIHGWLRWLYAASAMAAASMTILLARKVEAGPLATIALIIAGLAWLLATTLDNAQTWRSDARTQRRWMAISLTLTALTVSLHLRNVLSVQLETVCLVWIVAILAVEMWLCRKDGGYILAYKNRLIWAASPFFSIGVEIDIDTLDGWDFSITRQCEWAQWHDSSERMASGAASEAISAGSLPSAAAMPAANVGS
jgi:hypothetical protein